MSNDIPGNPYLEDATGLTAEASLLQEWTDAERAILAQQGTTYATLALAYEQRTANLIAMTTLVVECLNTKRGIDDESATVLNARLGLDEVQK